MAHATYSGTVGGEVHLYNIWLQPVIEEEEEEEAAAAAAAEEEEELASFVWRVELKQLNANPPFDRRFVIILAFEKHPSTEWYTRLSRLSVPVSGKTHDFC